MYRDVVPRRDRSHRVKTGILVIGSYSRESEERYHRQFLAVESIRTKGLIESRSFFVFYMLRQGHKKSIMYNWTTLSRQPKW